MWVSKPGVQSLCLAFVRTARWSAQRHDRFPPIRNRPAFAYYVGAADHCTHGASLKAIQIESKLRYASYRYCRRRVPSACIWVTILWMGDE